MSEKKYDAITIRIEPSKKQQLQELADNERRTLGGLLYIWIIDELERIKKQ